MPYWQFVAVAPPDIVQALSHYVDPRGELRLKDEREIIVAVRKWLLEDDNDPITPEQLLTERPPVSNPASAPGSSQSPPH